MESPVSTERFSEINSSLTSVDFKMISLMRLLLSFAALIIVFIDPTEPDRFVAITYVTLLIYFLYSLAVFALSLRRGAETWFITVHWIDVVFYAVLISLSSGTNSVFFFFFLFSILTSSFSLGFRYGMSITIISTTLFTVIGYLSAPSGTAFEMNRFLLRPIYLLLLGYMMSYWGGSEILSKKRLALLKDISRLANPRLGSNQTIELIFNNILAYYQAENCILITVEAADAGSTIFEKNIDSPLHVERLPAASPLIRLPEQWFASFENESRIFSRNPRYSISQAGAEKPLPLPVKTLQSLADLLNTDHFLTAPLFRFGEFKGRLYLTGKNGFPDPDLNFLHQIAEYVFPTIENIRLLDKLASSATEQERFRISRDIHDGTIQPYIGLRLGLESLELRLEKGKSIRQDLKKLLKMTDAGISNLRDYVRHLKDPAQEVSDSALSAAIKQNLSKYREFYGINVHLDAPANLNLNDRLAAEIFQLINEGLSNIRRHTRSNQVQIELAVNHDKLVLRIENSVRARTRDFAPKSIVGRVRDLGGRTEVIRTAEFTRIIAEIPLL